MARTLQQLETAFCEEDTATWTKAAIEIGRRAGQDAGAAEIITRWLAASPAVVAEDAESSESNIHRFRHACCSLASHLSEEGESLDHFSPAIDREVRGPFTALAFAGLPADSTLQALMEIPTLAAEFERWKGVQVEAVSKRVAQFEDGSNPKALQANQKKLTQLEALGPSSKIPKGFNPQAKLYDHSAWALASYFAGVRSPDALLGFPPQLLCKGLVVVAEARRAGGLPFVLNAAGMISRLAKLLPPESLEASKRVLSEGRIPAWANERLHYNEYVVQLHGLVGGDFLDLWTHGLDLPKWLLDALRGLREEQGSRGNRASARILRRITDEYFADDWRWYELNDGSRFALNAFTFLLSPKCAVLMGVDPKKHKGLQLEHRLAILLEALQASYKARDQVLPALVRCLKTLLHEQLRLHDKRQDLSDVCRRQIALVQPLLAEWQLPGTLRKDLATIICRVLLRTYRSDRASFVELLYTVLFSLPDEVLFRELIEYSSEPEVSDLVECIVYLIERWHQPPLAGSHAAAPAAGAYAPDRQAFGVYARYVQRLAKIAGDDERVRWVGRLSALIGYLSRVPAGFDLGDPEVTKERSERDLVKLESSLFGVLMCRRKNTEAWALLAPTPRTDRKGAQWAALEYARSLEQDARRTFDHFQRILDDVQVLETDCLPEVGRPRPSDDLVRRWRRLITTLDELTHLCADELPYLERELCVHLLRTRINDLERRLHALVEVLEKEEEAVAIDLLARQVAKSDGSDAALDLSNEDAELVQEWMLDRYMIRELAQTLRLRVLRLLTSPVFVFLWILTPFAACVILNRVPALLSWRGVPFAIVTAFNVLLMVLFFVEAQQSKTATAATGRFLLPQITAALFLGLIEIITTDEAWSLAVLEYPWVRIFTVLSFLLTGFFFTREVLLGNQLQAKSDFRRKNDRAGSVMALVMWQSFTLVVLFGILGGRVMGSRALEAQHLQEISHVFGEWLPHTVHLGRWFIEPAASGATAAARGYTIYPWALMTWTVQVFFFSAIFERIMKGSSD